MMIELVCLITGFVGFFGLIDDTSQEKMIYLILFQILVILSKISMRLKERNEK